MQLDYSFGHMTHVYVCGETLIDTHTKPASLYCAPLRYLQHIGSALGISLNLAKPV